MGRRPSARSRPPAASSPTLGAPRPPPGGLEKSASGTSRAHPRRPFGLQTVSKNLVDLRGLAAPDVKGTRNRKPLSPRALVTKGVPRRQVAPLRFSGFDSRRLHHSTPPAGEVFVGLVAVPARTCLVRGDRGNNSYAGAGAGAALLVGCPRWSCATSAQSCVHSTDGRDRRRQSGSGAPWAARTRLQAPSPPEGSSSSAVPSSAGRPGSCAGAGRA